MLTWEIDAEASAAVNKRYSKRPPVWVMRFGGDATTWHIDQSLWETRPERVFEIVRGEAEPKKPGKQGENV